VKLALVVQRYGPDIAGGSEAHCRELAERLAPRHDITVLTTCARDYVTWANALPAGTSQLNGVRVMRFPVARTRRLKAFAELTDEVYGGYADRQTQEAWFHENGPQAPDLLEYLRAHGREFDAVLFWAFRYFPSYFGVPLVADRAVLVPTAEEDGAIDMSVLADFFLMPAGYIFLTPEEQALVSARAGQDLPPSTVIGAGLDPAGPTPSRAVLDQQGLPPTYVLYLGRVDRNKGCDSLLEYFLEYAGANPGVSLVLAGPAKMAVPSHPQIRALGYVSDALRDALLAHARVLAVPSPYESLSIALLEGWNHGVPALVNARCKVLQGQVRRAGGGLYYRSAWEFHEALDYLLTHETTRLAFGAQGRAYVDREYRWPTVVARVEELLARLRLRPASGGGGSM
jgi:glycosyltransferase involved in cell wall biosynthesis